MTSSDEELVKEVEAVLAKRAVQQDTPNDLDLFPVHNLLLPSTSSNISSSSTVPRSPTSHWYCSKAFSPLHREAATYLIILFAFRREGLSASWLTALEGVLLGCDECARAFAGARRRLGAKYLSTRTASTRTSFFRAIDKWQSAFILQQHGETSESHSTGSTSGTSHGQYLPSPVIQLLFAEPSLLTFPGIPEILDSIITISISRSTPSPVTALGLTTTLIRLLSSPNEYRRKWAASQLSFAARRQLSLEEWTELGMGHEVSRLYEGSVEVDDSVRWLAVKAIIQSNSLSLLTVQNGLLQGSTRDNSERHSHQGVMSALSAVLGTESDNFAGILDCFAVLLRMSPTRHIWSFDTSAELPHTLFAEIRNNPSFHAVLLDRFLPIPVASLPAPADHPACRNKGEGLIDIDQIPLSWISPFLLSLLNLPDEGRSHKENGFGEALAQVMAFCLQDMQHGRFEADVQSGAAHAAFEALLLLQVHLETGGSSTHSTTFSSTIELHATLITAVALNPQSHPGAIWSRARNSARSVLAGIYRCDGRAICDSMLVLSTVDFDEKRRRLRAKKLKGDVPPPVPVPLLPCPTVRKALWDLAYDTISATDISGMAMLINSIANFAHLDKLDRHEVWLYEDVAKVVKEDEWITSIRAINHGLVITRRSFARCLESIAMQPDPDLIRRLWQEERVAKSAVKLLLSPVDELHDPVISLIQHSFDNVDDRGDCFYVLLNDHPAAAMDALCEFLQTFIITARIAPEACGLAKWLVRCFTDVLEALCRPTESCEPLLQYQAFLSANTDNRAMTRRISDLWDLMTTSLAVIFKRTPTWATLYASEIMVDWMRDALIFGRQITDHIRAFETAAFGREATTIPMVDGVMESPAKATTVGQKMVQKLEVVLEDLVLWLRLTDLETLHQTFELIKTILGRVSKSSPDLSKDPKLEATLYEIDKFSRRAAKNYRTRLSDDLLSELADQLVPFNLDLTIDDEVQYLGSAERSSTTSAPTAESTSSRSLPVKAVVTDSTKAKDAFAEMMKKASSSKGSELPVQLKVAKATKPTPGSSKQTSIDVDNFEDDFLSNFSTSDLDIIEKRARMSSGLPQAQTAAPRPLKPVRPAQPSSKLTINIVPKPAGAKPIGGTVYKSRLMREARFEHKQQVSERKKAEQLGGVVPRLPAAYALGSGLGAYQGERKKIQPVESSGSSASNSSSDEENKGIAGLIRRQKSPKKATRAPLPDRRPIKILGTSMADIVRQREDRRASQHAIKQRLRPDLNPLYRYVLAWDPLQTGPMAPHPPKHAAKMSNLVPVPVTFPNSSRYEQVMLPLYLQEVWAQCIQGKHPSSPVPVEISTRTYEDDFLDLDLTVQGQIPFDFYVNDSDVVLLRHQTARPLFAKVQGFKRKFNDTALKIRILVDLDQKELAGRSRWQLHKHLSLSTALREFGALRGLPYYEHDILADILAARSAQMPKLSVPLIDAAKKAYDVNELQARSILGAMSVKGFALIQGPPGTGKTKTISGLVGKFMSDRQSFVPTPGEKPIKSKLLVCAPSNAAIDEVCKRLMNGVPGSSGGRLNPVIVRIGIDAAVNIAAKDISLDSLVEARVNADPSGKNGGGGDYARIQVELDEVKIAIRLKQDELKDVHGHDERRRTIENEYHGLITRRTQLGQQSSKAKDASRDATRHLEGARRAAREAILNEADVICSTLAGAGQDTLSPYTFETVIIDEAAQAIEMSCLIPLKYGCKRCIMVGDPNQLPPTTFSSEAERLHYNESLFVRIAKKDPSNVQLLSIQYRMHPNISELPSKVFYDGQLKDGPDMAKQTAALWHARGVFGPYRFFNVEGTEIRAGTSTKNPQEALVAVDLYRRLEEDFGSKVNLMMRIGVISMYKEQLFELKQKFTEVFGAVILERIEFNTVDGFQGQEKDIIILSCVRSGPNLRTIGFLKDARRMNVALTRAKSSLFVIGNGPTLERSNDRWRTIVGDARDRGFFVNYGPATFAATPIVTPERNKVRRERPASPSTKIASSTPEKIDAKTPRQSSDVKKLKRKPSLESGLQEKRKRLELGIDSNGHSTMPKKPTHSTDVTDDKGCRDVHAHTSVELPRPNGSHRPNIPPPAGRVHPGPPPPPSRPPEDVLFIKRKKKKHNQSGTQANGLPNVPAAVNDRQEGR